MKLLSFDWILALGSGCILAIMILFNSTLAKYTLFFLDSPWNW